MSIPDEFEEALSQEFVCHYQVTELPESWDEWRENLQEIAQDAADRMKIWFDPVLSPRLAAYLRLQSQQRRGELVTAIEGWTRFAWHHKDKDWAVLHQLLNTIADCLDGAR